VDQFLRSACLDDHHRHPMSHHVVQLAGESASLNGSRISLRDSTF
jgi:hypothetical protein